MTSPPFSSLQHKDRSQKCPAHSFVHHCSLKIWRDQYEPVASSFEGPRTFATGAYRSHSLRLLITVATRQLPLVFAATVSSVAAKRLGSTTTSGGFLRSESSESEPASYGGSLVSAFNNKITYSQSAIGRPERRCSHWPFREYHMCATPGIPSIGHQLTFNYNLQAHAGFLMLRFQDPAFVLA